MHDHVAWEVPGTHQRKDNYHKFYNTNYKTYQLKDKLIKHFSKIKILANKL